LRATGTRARLPSLGDDAYASRFERRIVGARQHEELWVPAEELATFNTHLRVAIAVVSGFFGARFAGDPPEPHPRALLQLLAAAQQRGDDALLQELQSAQLATFLYTPYWLASPADELGIDARSLAATLPERGEKVPPG
jgi:hypothetical protein